MAEDVVVHDEDDERFNPLLHPSVGQRPDADDEHTNDVLVTFDGRCLDSPEKVRAWLDELNTALAPERRAAAG